jgi:dihydrolipoamide dehydrogenase
VQTAFAIKEAEHTFAKLGVQVGAPQLDFATANEWKAGVVKQMVNGVASLFKANGVEWVQGHGPVQGREHDRGRGGEDVTFKSAVRRTGLVPAAPADRRGSTPRAVSTPRACSGRRRCRAGSSSSAAGIIGCEFASIFNRFGSEVTIIEMLPKLIPAEDDDAAKELAKQFGRRGITLISRSSARRSRRPATGCACTSATVRRSTRT